MRLQEVTFHCTTAYDSPLISYSMTDKSIEVMYNKNTPECNKNYES